MAQSNDPLSLIQRRKAEMEASRLKEKAERERLDAEAAARAKEEEELEIAERVLARLAQHTSPPPRRPATISKAVPTKKIPATGGTPRPANIPSVAEMVTELLLDTEKAGRRGLTSSEIMAGIDARWWPGVSVNLILPTLYRAIKRNYWFKKDGNLFIRLPDGQPPKRGAGANQQLKLDS